MQEVDPSAAGQHGTSGAVDLVLYKAIVEQLPDAIVVADRAGFILVWNRAAEALFGFAAAEAIGRSLDIIIPERFRAAHWEGFHRAVASGRTRLGSQVRTTRSMHKLQHKLYVDLSFGLVADAAGAVVGSMAVARDCSARYEAEKALKTRLAELEARTS